MKLKLVLLRTLALAVAIAGAGPAMAAHVVLDQYSVPQTGLILPPPLNGEGFAPVGLAIGPLMLPLIPGQSFKAGLTGKLDEIDVGLFGPAPIGFTFDLYDSALGTGPVLFSEHFAGSGMPPLPAIGVTTWDDLLKINVLSGNVHVVPGQVLSFALTPDAGGPPPWVGYLDSVGGANGSPIDNFYAPGAVLFNDIAGLGTFPDSRGVSGAFRTYVAAVPEPAAWALMLIGFSLAGATIRRRKVAFP